LADFDPRHRVLSDNGLYGGILKNTIADHMACSSGNDFFARLKKKFDCSFEAVFQCMKNFQRAQ
jgi:hypothetical protein